MIHAIGNAADLVVHLVAFQKLAGAAAPGREIGREFSQVGRDVVGVVIKRFVIDEFSG
jgi:hypothetical protein